MDSSHNHKENWLVLIVCTITGVCTSFKDEIREETFGERPISKNTVCGINMNGGFTFAFPTMSSLCCY